MSTLRILLLFGGTSAEHDVSIQSARNIARAMRPERYEPLPVYIAHDGSWHLLTDPGSLLSAGNFGGRIEVGAARRVYPVPHEGGVGLLDGETHRLRGAAGCVWPALHGPCGEDGTVQGMCTLWSVPFVGAGVAGSAVGMDKDLSKRLMRESGIPVPDFVVLRSPGGEKASYGNLRDRLGGSMFVKPANLGSSVGISRVESEEDFVPALERAFRFDRKIIVERTVEGREIECALLEEGGRVSASLPGEIVPRDGFYSYRAKYVDADGARLLAPADLSASLTERIQRLAVDVFTVLCCEGMARVDFLVDRSEAVFVNEINTLPGFTPISMYPRLWQISGVPAETLIDKLVDHALARHRLENTLRGRTA
jgi:D-alanine-D-alanine ligase